MRASRRKSRWRRCGNGRRSRSWRNARKFTRTRFMPGRSSFWRMRCALSTLEWAGTPRLAASGSSKSCTPRGQPSRRIAIRDGARSAILWPQDLPPPPTQCVDRTFQSPVCGRHHLYSDRGFRYLGAIIDGASRAVLSWRLSNTMDVCRAALEEACAKFGKPEIFDTDRGSQFTSATFTGARGPWRPDLDGRARPLNGQRLHRTAMAIFEARRYLSQRLRRWLRGEAWDRRLDGILQ
jgi:transposase InsO family protein